jgi:hypothetical protein
MKFRFVLLGPDDDPDAQMSQREAAPAVTPNPYPALRYQQKGTDIVRSEQRENGRSKCTVVANLAARITREIVIDDGDEARRVFAMEAKVGRRTIVFSVSAAEFGRMNWVLSQLGGQAIVCPGIR